MNVLRRKAGLVALLTVMAIVAGSLGVGAAEKVNINTATIEQLMQLDRVGASYAQRIVEYREKYGPFQSPEDIMKVKGIGKKTWEANKDRIAV